MPQSAMHGRMGRAQDRIAGGGREAAALLRDIAAFAGRGGIATALAVAAGALLEGIGLALIVPLIGVVIAPSAPSGRLERIAAAVFAEVGIDTAQGRLILLVVALGVVVAARAAVSAVRDVRVATLQVGFSEGLRLRLARRLAAAPWESLTRLRYARITQLMGAEVQSIGAAAGILLRTAVAAAMLAAQAVLLLSLAPLLMFAVFAVLAAGAIVLVPLVRRAYGVGVGVTRGNLSLIDTTSQFLGGLKLAIGQNLQPAFLSEFGRTLNELAARQVDFARGQARARATSTVLTTAASGALVLAGFGIFHAPASALIVLVVVIARMSGPAGQIQQGAQLLARLLPAYASMRALERELAALPLAAAPARRAPLPDGPVAFHAVTYVHGGGGDVRGVAALDLAIAPGECVGITGPSGAGKTTFADLLAGLLTPQAGRIAIGGVPLEAATLDAWREGIAYVAQDAFLFHDSVRRNLAWMAPQASEAEMWRALEAAGAAGLVHRMERGLDTVVGERGSLVSGGERQRLALARAVLRRPRVMILDEATSAIDAAAERDILMRLSALSARPTIILIAHRAESLALCGRILTFEDGRIASDRRG
ncbi:MAG TPA: ABC transporter ATP-binding protein [Pseudolabrys sp.]|nr:ABC transporter ATP-binding protein [Pseudolabrys sp.]